MKKLRKEITNREEKEKKLLENFIQSDLLSFRSFFVYNSFSTEADTKNLIALLKREGKKVYLPRVEGDIMVAVEDSGSFQKSNYGIEEPIGNAYLGEFDVCVLPLLAVDQTGHRLGYGGGYYDKFLKDRNCIKVAYAFFCQVVDEVPFEKTDIAVDAIVTEENFLFIEKGRKE